MSGQVHDSLKDALANRDGWVEFTDGGCRCQFGFCIRLDPIVGNHDWYEPNEPELKREGLPWFYFIPSADNLVEECREQYLRESRELWGNDRNPS